MAIISLIRILNVIASCALQKPQSYLLGKYDNECRSGDGRGLSDMARAFHEHCSRVLWLFKRDINMCKNIHEQECTETTDDATNE